MRTRLAAASMLLLLAAGCGGGVYIGFGGDDDDRPDVSLVVSPSQARSGEVVRLSAAASDDFGVDRVEFFRLDSGNRAVFLAADSSPPYQLDTVMPQSSAATVFYFARATDDVGQQRDSELAGVNVLP